MNDKAVRNMFIAEVMTREALRCLEVAASTFYSDLSIPGENTKNDRAAHDLELMQLQLRDVARSLKLMIDES